MLHVHSYETFATQDGPGIRLVIFLQGCMFRCKYCQNPDTIPFGLPLSGEMSEGQRGLMSAEDILALAMKQKEYFGDTGGVTFSGGEPLLQAKELAPVLKLLQENGFHTCIDTNAYLLNEEVKECLKYTNHILPDIKQVNPDKHKELTGLDNQHPMDFVRYLDAEQKTYRIRYVVVPERTDQEADIRLLGEFLQTLPNFQRIELLPYHNLGRSKRDKLGWEYPLEGVHASTVPELETVKKILNEYTDNVFIRG
ncbi:pyruvate formate-lyase-activating enzyme [Bacteroidia bacterium]|nr:pyruvate formate-lyase-activating enzyme [Clostridia bacterium]GHV24637.1 pyruvate formate-lyase-activating enzyme [Bacteroidia bacterium]